MNRNSILVFLSVLVFGQIAWLAITAFAFKNPDLVGAVFPGVLTTLTNNDRSTNDIPTLATSTLLTEAAQNKANDMATKGYFSHISPSGETPWYWLNQVGYKYTYAGENLAVDFSDSADVESAWMKSPSHRANIMKGTYTQIGIATAKGIYKGRNATFVVEFFGTPAKVAPATSF